MAKGFGVLLIVVSGLGAFAAWADDAKPAKAAPPASVPVTVSVYVTGKEMADPCHMKFLLTWGPKPKGSLIPVSQPLSSTGASATTVLMVPQGHKETVTLKETFSSNCQVGDTCPKGVLSVSQTSQADASSSGTCHKGYSDNQITFIAGGTATLVK